MEKLNIEKPLLHIFVCVNDRCETQNGQKTSKPSCGPTIDLEELKNLKIRIKLSQISCHVKLTQTKCLGFCSPIGSIILLQPKQEYYLINSVKEIEDLIKSELSITTF